MTESTKAQDAPIRVLGRNHYACSRCKTSKIKCSGDRPACKNCVQSGNNHDCVYPYKDRKVIILQSQLEKLHKRIHELENGTTSVKLEEETIPKHKRVETPNQELHRTPERESPEEIQEAASNPLFPHSDRVGSISCQVFDHALESFLGDYGGLDGSQSAMSPPNSDSGADGVNYYLEDTLLESSSPSTFVSLPDIAYALTLIETVRNFNREYYFFDYREFAARVHQVYADLNSQDPIFLCHFLCVLAIGEQCRNGSLAIQQQKQFPGLEFFVNAIQLFRLNKEEHTAEYVQCVLCLGFFSQTLNRSNTAYGYYGLAMRLALVLGLHRKQPEEDRVVLEKRKRVWWTVFVLDSLWASKIGMPVHIEIGMTDVALPMEGYEDLDDGFEIAHLHENVNLCQYIAKIVRKVYSPPSTLECLNDLVKLEITCQEYTQSIHENGVLQIHNQLSRGVVNLYLRFNHLVIITTRPLALAIFKKSIPETAETRQATTRCIVSACYNIDALSNLKNFGQLTTGFWDGQHCFSALLILIMASLSGNQYLPYIYKGVDILKFLAQRGNINAKSHYNRLKELDRLLVTIAEKNKSFSLSLGLGALKLDDVGFHILPPMSKQKQRLHRQQYTGKAKTVDVPSLLDFGCLPEIDMHELDAFGLTEKSSSYMDLGNYFLYSKIAEPGFEFKAEEPKESEAKQQQLDLQTLRDINNNPHFTYGSPDVMNGLDYLVNNIEGWVNE
ncbi:hypothetical protein BABINDRAFT_53068 [Babjeviella inositovora NRRL Y-12698]|uniref:Zn(2)-C6 fungal-type domain-containing protein n=1 Tax=Babjeviella inositovora NRRL Y-12698 TaxID=984486 RepID=A0A1E3QMX5_9ASCO|nr:uncharacterized protein BABINDRAFT_53068 [Babjeviella inositovora NRRL Y-12698]ODQ78347.1 hypothetical protein BABINDRAFT_53068 [Babjeviella inositovora NRRL Y-12698]